MTRVLVVWEDDRFEMLNRFVKGRLATRKPPEQPTFPHVMFHTSRGNGRFKPYVRDTWTRIRGSGLPGDAGPIDHLICVVDGDKLHELLPSVSNPATNAPPVDEWHQAAMVAWQDYLRKEVDPSVPPSTVHGCILRWCKESLALAGYDQPPAVEFLGLDPRSPGLQAYLLACKPEPGKVAAPGFSDSYPKPVSCLDKARSKAGCSPGSIKNTPEIDDTLKALAQGHLDLVCSRVPDIDQIVDLLWRLSVPGRPPAPAENPLTTSGKREKNTSKSRGMKRSK